MSRPINIFDWGNCLFLDFPQELAPREKTLNVATKRLLLCFLEPSAATRSINCTASQFIISVLVLNRSRGSSIVNRQLHSSQSRSQRVTFKRTQILSRIQSKMHLWGIYSVCGDEQIGQKSFKSDLHAANVRLALELGCGKIRNRRARGNHFNVGRAPDIVKQFSTEDVNVPRRLRFVHDFAPCKRNSAAPKLLLETKTVISCKNIQRQTLNGVEMPAQALKQSICGVVLWSIRILSYSNQIIYKSSIEDVILTKQGFLRKLCSFDFGMRQPH